MKTLNEQNIIIDFQRPIMIPIYRFKQFDNNVINFTVKENGIDADLSNISSIVANFKRADGETISRQLKNSENIITYKIGNTETSVPGKSKIVIQFYDDQMERISTAKLDVEIVENIEANLNFVEEEEGLYQQIITRIEELKNDFETINNEATELIEQVTIVSENATNQANYAKEQGDYAKLEGDKVINAISDLTTLKEEINVTISESSVATTKANEATNKANTATKNANTATENANSISDKLNLLLPNVEGLENIGSYDASKAYEKNNIVEHNGSSFQALKDTTGNTPPTLPTKSNEFWQLIAQRGIDGEGSVSTVNGKSPSVDGNVTLNAEDVGSINVNKIGVPNGIASLNQDGKVPSTQLDVDLSNLATKEEVELHENENATTSSKGHVQLTSVTDSESEVLGATAKAVKTAYDRANEAFTSASNGKNSIGTAITGVDPSVIIPSNPTFDDLKVAIQNISTGKKYLQGTITHSYKAYELNPMTVNGLDFVPSFAFFISNKEYYDLIFSIKNSYSGSFKDIQFISPSTSISGDNAKGAVYISSPWCELKVDSVIAYPFPRAGTGTITYNYFIYE